MQHTEKESGEGDPSSHHADRYALSPHIRGLSAVIRVSAPAWASEAVSCPHTRTARPRRCCWRAAGSPAARRCVRCVRWRCRLLRRSAGRGRPLRPAAASRAPPESKGRRERGRTADKVSSGAGRLRNTQIHVTSEVGAFPRNFFRGISARETRLRGPRVVAVAVLLLLRVRRLAPRVRGPVRAA